MPRGLDHLVLCVRDLDAATATYRGLGFQLGAENHHPWGTRNRLIQTPGFFIELLAVEVPDKFEPPAENRVSFGRFTADWLDRHGDGVSTLVLESADAAADLAAFHAAGLGRIEPFHFARQGVRPDGSVVEVAFSLAFAVDPRAPAGTGYFTCQQHFPQNFWSEAYQRHPNGVAAVRAVVLVADEPRAHRPFFEAFAGAPSRLEGADLVVETPRGRIEVMTPAHYGARVGVLPPPLPDGPRVAAVRFAVAGPVPGDVAPDAAHGLALLFEPA